MHTPVKVSDGVLVGNAFPLSLIRRRVTVEPASVDDLRIQLQHHPVRSFWGHESTVTTASQFLGCDLTPKTARPALICDTATGLPALSGEIFAECWVVSPEYTAGYRPAIGADLPESNITGWRVLKMTWDQT